MSFAAMSALAITDAYTRNLLRWRETDVVDCDSDR
jgi:hypothetical protein